MLGNGYGNPFPSGMSRAEPPGPLCCSRRKTSARPWGPPAHVSSTSGARARGGDGPALLGRVGFTEKGRVETSWGDSGRKNQDERGGEMIGSHRSLEMGTEEQGHTRGCSSWRSPGR